MLSLKVMGITIQDLDSEHIKKIGNTHFAYRGNKTLATIQGSGNGIEFQIDPYLGLDEFQFLRKIILDLCYGNESAIDERDCQLGYLENGEKAYLIKNWEEWKAFLMKAKLKTLEGQNVQALNEQGEELGSGLLAEYEITTTPFRIRSCTLITLFGERKFEGANLSIVPTNQFS
jgi:hypothetical protein